MRLDGRPHVPIARHEIPAGRLELVGVDPTGLVNPARRAGGTVLQHGPPGDVAVALHDRVSATQLVRFFGIQRRVDATEHHVGAALAHFAADLVAAQRVARVNADADDVPGADGRQIE